MVRLACTFFALCSLFLLCGCSDYLEDYRYVPHPGLAEIQPAPPDKVPPVSTFASIVGIHRADKDEDIPESVEVRFRLENNGPHTVSFDPQSVTLLTGDLSAFESPIARPERPADLTPNQTAIYQLFFAFPHAQRPDNTDLRSLQLRWRVQIDGNTVTQTTSFRRTYPRAYYYYPDPYWGDPWFYYDRPGFIIVGHRR